MAWQQLRIDEHADRDEKDRAENVPHRITVLDSAARPPARTGGSLGEEFGWTRKSKGRLKRGRPLSHRSLM
jgi:hypothetical protein